MVDRPPLLFSPTDNPINCHPNLALHVYSAEALHFYSAVKSVDQRVVSFSSQNFRHSS